jgi:excisionase family DNA binding protein
VEAEITAASNGSQARPAASKLTRWGQLSLGIICLVMIANLQYGWTLFIDPIDAKHHWGRAAIQVAFTIFIVTETWTAPIAGYLVDRFGPRVLVLASGVLVAAVEGFLDKVGVAKRLGVQPKTVADWARAGKLPAYLIGPYLRFKWSEVEAHLAATCRVRSAPDNAGACRSVPDGPVRSAHDTEKAETLKC